MSIDNVTYDKQGRMKYNPEVHFNNQKPWTTTEQNYFIQHYENIGAEQMSYELGRTVYTLMDRAYELRKKGLMPKRSTSKRKRC